VLSLQGIVDSANGPTLLLQPQERPGEADATIKAAPAEVVIAGATSNDVGFPRRYAQHTTVAILLQGSDGRYVLDEGRSDWNLGEISLPLIEYPEMTHLRADATIDPADMVIKALSAKGVEDASLRIAPLGLFMVRDGESIEPSLQLCSSRRSPPLWTAGTCDWPDDDYPPSPRASRRWCQRRRSTPCRRSRH
jgi:hypothetical protein